MSDISQIMTFITFSVYHKIPIIIYNVTTEKVKNGLAQEINYLAKMGISLEFNADSIYVNHQNDILPINIDVTSISIYSDHQPLFALMLLKANGNSTITEHVWKKRFDYAKELQKLGLKLHLDGQTLKIMPSTPVQSAEPLHARDLRSAAVLTIAALAAPKKTQLYGLEHLVRGYDHFIQDLSLFGSKIEENTDRYPLCPSAMRVKNYHREHLENTLDLKRCELIHPYLEEILTSLNFDNVKKINIYPNIESAKEIVAQQLHLSPKNLIFSAGSDCMASYIVQALTKITKRIILQYPNYFGWENYATLNDVDIKKIYYTENIINHLDQPPSLVIISNPNNPTGLTLSKHEILHLSKKCQEQGHILIIDECFSAFAGLDHYDILGINEHTIFVRSYSKCYGLAGVRIAITIASQSIVDYLSRWRPDSGISREALNLIAQVHKHKSKFNEIYQDISDSREKFIQSIKILKPEWHALPTKANFVAFNLGTENAYDFANLLRKKNILIKAFSPLATDSNYIRIGIVHEMLMRYVVRSIEEMDEVCS